VTSSPTSGIPIKFNDGGLLCCLTAAYLNLSSSQLSAHQISSIANLAISETMLAEKLSVEAFPIRMTHPFILSGVPPTAGDYLVLLTGVHTDGLRVLPSGGLQFFASDTRLSKVVLTEDDAYVKNSIINRVDPYQAIRLVCRGPTPTSVSGLSNAQRRAIAKKRKFAIN
jgi:hypothetical protein